MAGRIYKRRNVGGEKKEPEKDEDSRGQPLSYSTSHGVRLRLTEVREWEMSRGKR